VNTPPDHDPGSAPVTGPFVVPAPGGAAEVPGAPTAAEVPDIADPLDETGISGVEGLARVTPVVFRAGCPDCRARFELPAAALRLAIGGSPNTTFYSFTCPECETAVRKPAGERIVELLTEGGVRTLRLHSTV
jgi:hypothetical protein